MRNDKIFHNLDLKYDISSLPHLGGGIERLLCLRYYSAQFNETRVADFPGC